MKHTPLEPLHRVSLRGTGDMVREDPSAPVGEEYEHGMLEKPVMEMEAALAENPVERIPANDAVTLPEEAVELLD